MDVVDLIIEFNNLIVEGKYELENDEFWDDVGEIFLESPISNGEVGFTWCCSRELGKNVMLFMSLKRKIGLALEWCIERVSSLRRWRRVE